MKKYISVVRIIIFALTIGISLTGRTAVHAQTQPDNIASSNLLFPCDGVTLGKTTVEDLAKLGTRTTRIKSDTNQPFNYYIIKGQNVWFDERSRLASHYHIVHTGVLPEKWLSLGMLMENSYDQWLDFAKVNGLDVVVAKRPQIRIYNGNNTFSANLWLLYVADDIPYKIELNFDYSKGTTTADRNTLYSVNVSIQ